MKSFHICIFLIAVSGFVCQCQPPTKPKSGTNAATSNKIAPLKPVANTVSGRVTMADGTPLRGNIKEILIGLQGVTQVGKNTSFRPIVKNGTYSQKVPYGFFSFSTYSSYVVVVYNGQEFKLQLEPVGNQWDKTREATKGIVQDFVLKYTGPTPTGLSQGPNINIGNSTHWYGQCIGMMFATYREDIKQSQPAIPAGTKLVFTLTPTGPALDGSTIKPFTVERIYQDRYTSIDLNDLMPAPYNVSGVATLPNGQTKRILLQAKGDYPNFKPTVSAPMEPEEYNYSIHTYNVSFAIE